MNLDFNIVAFVRVYLAKKISIQHPREMSDVSPAQLMSAKKMTIIDRTEGPLFFG